MRPLFSTGGFAQQRRSGTYVIVPYGTPIPATNSHILATNIPPIYDELLVYLNAVSCDTTTRILQLQWSYNNGASFFTDGMFGHAILATSVSAMSNTGNMLGTAAVSNAAAFTGNAYIRHYADPMIPTLIEGGGTHDGANAWSVRALDIYHYGAPEFVLNALRLIWNNTGVFDGGAVYGLMGVIN